MVHETTGLITQLASLGVAGCEAGNGGSAPAAAVSRGDGGATASAAPDCETSERRYQRSRALRVRAHAAIPGGCHTYSKADDQYPQLSPGFILRGQGCRVWDVDGNCFIEYGLGLRAVTLGHAHQPVVKAVRAALELGTNFTRPHPLEVECAEALLDVVPAADMVKFTKDGSTATTAAVKLARAATGRKLVALCRDHPFFSYDDWFIGTTSMDAGIPASQKSCTVQFPFGDVAALRSLFAAYRGRIACVMMETCKYQDPPAGYLHAVRELCHAEGALLIFDEMINGFRLAHGGGQERYGVEPDLSVFGKAMANGFALSALAGKREFMELGGLLPAEQRVFLLSTTHGAETPALAAALATMRIYRSEPVIETLERQGRALMNGLREVIAAHRLGEHVSVLGFPANLVFATRDRCGQPSQAFRALLMQELIRNGVLAQSLVISYAHDDSAIAQTFDAFEAALDIYARALEGGVEKHLVGPPTRIVYKTVR